MAEARTAGKGASSEGSRAVDAYLAHVAPASRATLQRLRRLVRKVAPGAEEVLSYRIPAFRQGRIVIWYAAFRDHCSLFIGSLAVQRRFARELAPFVAGKGTVRFTPDRPLPDGLIVRIVRARLAENAAILARRPRPAARAARSRGRSRTSRGR